MGKARNSTGDLDRRESEAILQTGAQALGITLTPGQIDQFLIYRDLLKHWNRRWNLTALRSDSEIIIKHFLDSLLPLPYLPDRASLLDIGSGAGFPGLPLKIARPSLSVTLLESSGKKISFLKEVARNLQLKDLAVVQGFLGKGSPFRWNGTPFDLAISRAVGQPLPLLSAVRPWLKTKGRILFLKGPRGEQEFQKLEQEIRKRGFGINRSVMTTLPVLHQKRVLIFLEKENGPLPAHARRGASGRSSSGDRPLS